MSARSCHSSSCSSARRTRVGPGASTLLASWIEEELHITAITVRNLDPDTRDRLKLQASAHGRFMEAEARAILTAAVVAPAGREGGLGSRIRALFADIDGDGIPAPRRDDAAPAASFTP